MQMVPVASSSLAAVGYENGTLVVAFRSGLVYQYNGVPAGVANALLAAPSKGRYYTAFIRGTFPSMRIR